MKFYAAIDLKSFYSSVECQERGLDPLTTNLVVADPTRTDKTICLAISPALRQKYGLPGRARLFEVNAKAREFGFDFIIAPPRMSYYLEYSQKIYRTYLDFVAPEDIFAYSIDEVFCDISSYLKLHNYTPAEFVSMMIREVFERTGITATAGIGTNLFLAKIAMDIIAKHAEPNSFGARLAELTEKTFREQLWAHEPLTDFWRIGPATARSLKNRGMRTLGDVARCSLINEELLFQLFGVNAELLIDHAWGIETATIPEIKNYRPRAKSLSNGQVLNRPYPTTEARTIVKEMSESLALELAAKHYSTNHLVLHIIYDVENTSAGQKSGLAIKSDHYGRKIIKPAHGTIRLPFPTSAIATIRNYFLQLFDQIIDPKFSIRKIYLSTGSLISADAPASDMTLFQPDLFTDLDKLEFEIKRNQKLEQAILDIRKRFGKNAILTGSNFEPGATGRHRHHQIGGHQA